MYLNFASGPDFFLSRKWCMLVKTCMQSKTGINWDLYLMYLEKGKCMCVFSTLDRPTGWTDSAGWLERSWAQWWWFWWVISEQLLWRVHLLQLKSECHVHSNSKHEEDTHTHTHTHTLSDTCRHILIRTQTAEWQARVSQPLWLTALLSYSTSRLIIIYICCSDVLLKSQICNKSFKLCSMALACSFRHSLTWCFV